MNKPLYQVEFKDLRKAYIEVKAFLENQTLGKITSLKTKVEEGLRIGGDDTYELIEKFIEVYKLDATGFDIPKYFLSETELFNPVTSLAQILSLPFLILFFILKIISFGKLDFTQKNLFPQFGRETYDLTFGDMTTWYVTGRFNLRQDVRIVLKSNK
jgi:hypothetical protein